VEYYSADLQTGWVVAAYRVRTEAFTVDNLRNGDLLSFVVWIVVFFTVPSLVDLLLPF
jgi:hypothetical protein